jgi:hypothetical protein
VRRGRQRRGRRGRRVTHARWGCFGAVRVTERRDSRVAIVCVHLHSR